MMRHKLIVVFIIFSTISAELFAFSIGISPWQGGFGLNMATDEYAFGEGELKYDGGANSPQASTYSDVAIIGIGGVYQIYINNSYSQYVDERMSVSVHCDGGFYFTSRSNPDAKRPFEVILVLKGNSSYEYTTEYVHLGSNNELSVDNYSYPGKSGSYDSSSGERRFWCDMVICLPFDSITSTGVLTANGKTYNLIEADDYSAVITVTIEFAGQSESLTIPLSGYYSRNDTDPDASASLVVRSLPAAMNLNIGGPRTMERVALVDFMVNQTKYYVNGSSLVAKEGDDSTYHIFLSASNDPYVSAERGFELVHSSVNYTEPHTPYNSIGYKARLISTVDNTYQDFDGTDSVSGNDIPGIKLKRQVNNSVLHSGNTAWYSEFHGAVEVLINEVTATGNEQGVTGMLAGQYTSNIYVHVVEEA